MKNNLVIKIDEITTEFLLVTQDMEIGRTSYYSEKLYEYKHTGLGSKTIEAQLVYYFLDPNQEKLEKSVGIYLEHLLVGRNYDFFSIEDNPIVQQYQEIALHIKEKLNGNKFCEFESSGLFRKLFTLFKRVQFDLYKYQIDGIFLICESDLYTWIEKELKKVFNDIPIVKRKDLQLVKDNKEQRKLKKLVLKYFDKRYTLMEINPRIQESIQQSIEFNVKFALDTSIHFSIVETWRENGIDKEKTILQHAFQLPFFYPNDIIKLNVSYSPNEEYQFTVFHVDTGERETFNLSSRSK